MELNNQEESLNLTKLDISNKSSKLTYKNYNTEASFMPSSFKWPIKTISDLQLCKPQKSECKTSIDILNNRVKLRESSQKLIIKSEAYLESMIKLDKADSDLDSSFSEESVDPDSDANSKTKFDDLINKYYTCSSENIPGNYDSYVTSNLNLIGYFKSANYFSQAIKNIANQIIEMHNTLCFDDSKILLILDLDETLIHSDLNLKWSTHDYYIEFQDGTIIPINIRPFLFEFLDFCNQHFELIIFTASCSDYADPIIDYIEKEKSYFKYRFYREHCLNYGNLFLKDLSIFGKPLSKTMIVDNNLLSFSHYLNNGVLVSSFTNESDDLDLCSLIEYFKTLLGASDVRTEIEGTFGFNKLLNDLKYN